MDKNIQDYFQKFIDYISYHGGSVSWQQFDKDWEPIGSVVRVDMLKMGMAYQKDGKIYIAGV